VTLYRTIVADPPWPYPEGFANNLKPGKREIRALPYPSMSIGEIAALPVKEKADKDCRVFLWTTNRYLRDAFDVVSAWGFRYSQTLVWHKTGNPSPFGASVAPYHAEFVLVAHIGHPALGQRLPSQVIAAPVAQHSRKPDVFMDMFEAASPGPYCELFARRNRIGWDTWGDEALEHVDLEAS
jgi:N6-adenosine-specific RNA methylase IME4